jgi:predicted site-specific integrase-resolvase
MSYPCVRFELNIEPPEEVVDTMSLHPKESGGREELLDDFSSLGAAFAGRVYGMRPAGARRRLLAEPGQCPDGGGGR